MITQKELAKKLNISISTVSKALNNSPEIGKETIERVHALAKFYKYQPNQNAVNLKKRETKTIGVIVPNITNRFFAKVLFSIQEEASNLGYNIIICNSNESLQKEKDSLKVLSNGSVDGFIVAVSEETQLTKDYSHFEGLVNEEIPLIMFDRVLDKINCDKVIIDDADASKKAVNALIEKGRKQIAFVSTIFDLNVGKLREHSYEEAIKFNFNNKKKPLILHITPEKDSQSQIRSFLENNPKIDGVISADNISGTQTLNVAISMGYKIPEAISIIGFADDAISKLSVPKLSILDQNATKMGEATVHLLMKRLKNKADEMPKSTQIIPTVLNNAGSL
ncbi:MAG: LacI family transcriptional regulator [Bacteroidia bacterium]|nr:LacI family transcriptional regulator [Bacteroidia bacterium]